MMIEPPPLLSGIHAPGGPTVDASADLTSESFFLKKRKLFKCFHMALWGQSISCARKCLISRRVLKKHKPGSAHPPNSASIILYSLTPPIRCTKLSLKWINQGGNVKACGFGSCCVVVVRWNEGTHSEVTRRLPFSAEATHARQQRNADPSFTWTRPSPYLHDILARRSFSK